MTVLGRITRTEHNLAGPGRIERLCDWARANNLDPKEIPATLYEVILTVEEIDGERIIRYRRYVRSADGRIRRCPDGSGSLTEEVIAPLVVPMPESWDA